MRLCRVDENQGQQKGDRQLPKRLLLFFEGAGDRQIEIVETSLEVVRQQLEETQELIAVGRLARAELAAVQAEVAAGVSCLGFVNR